MTPKKYENPDDGFGWMHDIQIADEILREIEDRHRANGCKVFDEKMARCTCGGDSDAQQ